MSTATFNMHAWNTQAPHETALQALSLHCSVLPLNSIKKPPVKWKDYQTRLPTTEEVTDWEARYHPALWAMVTGSLSGVIVLDYDGETGLATGQRIGFNPHVTTGSGGKHQHFQHPGWKVKTMNHETSKDRPWSQAYPGLDIRADGGYAAFCGRNTSGPYQWLRPFEPDPLDILPEDLRRYLGLLYSPMVQWALDRIERLRGRDNACFALACQLRDNKVSVEEAESITRNYQKYVPSINAKGQLEPFTIEEALATLRSAYAGDVRQPWESTPSYTIGSNGHIPQPAAAPGSFNLTDLGNAERFASQYRDRVRWCHVWNSWMIFNGKYWEQDRSGQVDRLAKNTVRSIYLEAANEKDKARRQQIDKHAGYSESNRAVRAMLDRAKSELPATPDEFNTNIHLLNCQNGTLDLRNGQKHDHNPADMLTRCLKINYRIDAPCPTWISCLATIFAGNEKLIKFVQEALGMSLSGDTSEQCLFLCHGGGSNGKTTLLEAVRILLASYALAANIETFMVRKSEHISNDVAELYGARFVTAEETTLGGRLNEAFIKKATGKQPLRARRLHENEFEFMPEMTIWFAVNHKPVVKDTSKAMWRRVHFIPFNVTIESEQADKHLGEKLLQEAEGILAWLVQGCLSWYRQGCLSVPTDVSEATRAYRAEMDVIGRFLTDECELAANLKIGSTALLTRYESWCKQNGESYDAKALKSALNERGYRSKRGHGGLWIYPGIGLKVGDGGDGGDGESGKNQAAENLREKKSDSPSPTITTVTHEPTIQRCCTVFEMQKSEPHGSHEATLQDKAGNWWCDACILQHDFMNIGYERDYPEIRIEKKFRIKASHDEWVRFARNAGYSGLREALKYVEKQ